jgi:hypothetical protein
VNGSSAEPSTNLLQKGKFWVREKFAFLHKRTIPQVAGVGTSATIIFLVLKKSRAKKMFIYCLKYCRI